MDTTLLILSIILLLAGIAGSFLPVLPGPPLSYGAMILLTFTKYGQFSNTLLIVFGILTAITLIADYVIPIWSTGKFGGSKFGQRGAFAGMIIGLFFGPPGIIFGPFFGAIAGELIGGRSANEALKSGFGSFIGFLLGTGLKMIVSLAILFYFVKALLN